MKNQFWLEAAAYLVPKGDREAVIGDLAEAEASPRQILLEVLGLVVRREISLWKNWRPWAAALALALPTSFLLMGTSVSVLTAYQRREIRMVPDADAPLALAAKIFLLLAWSWTAGFVLVSLSRRTLWASLVACLVPCFFCFARFRMEELSPLSLFLFVLPGAFGVWQGIRQPRISPGFAAALAAAVTLLTILDRSGRLFWYHAALIWPIWYVAATAARSVDDRENRRTA